MTKVRKKKVNQKKAETTAPAAAPTRMAGENTPPKKPKLREIDVAKILPNKIIIKKISV